MNESEQYLSTIYPKFVPHLQEICCGNPCCGGKYKRYYDMDPLKNGKYRFDYQHKYISDVKVTSDSVTETQTFVPIREQYDRVLSEEDQQFAQQIRHVLANPTGKPYCCWCYNGEDPPQALQRFQATTNRQIRYENWGHHVLSFEFDLI